MMDRENTTYYLSIDERGLPTILWAKTLNGPTYSLVEVEDKRE